MNINAAKGLYEVMKTNLGPKGTIKMLVGGAGGKTDAVLQQLNMYVVVLSGFKRIVVQCITGSLHQGPGLRRNVNWITL